MGVYHCTLFAITYMPQNTLLSFWISVISSVLTPSGALPNFDYFLLSESTYLGGAHFTAFVLGSARTMHGSAKHFIHQEQRGNWSSIWVCNGMSYANISSIVMQDLLMPLVTLHVLFQSHSSMGDTPCMWGASSVKWHSTFSQWDLSIQQASHNSLTCLHVYVGCDTMLMNIPQKAIVVKSRKCNMIPKNIPFRLKSPLETVTFNWQKVHVWCQNCGYCT